MSSIPSLEVVKQNLKTLLRRNIDISKIAPPPAAHTAIVGIYKAGDGREIAACLCDVAFAAYTGAAFSLIPRRVADESVDANKLDEILEDNYGEVLNVLSRLFSTHDSQRVTLSQKLFPPSAIPAAVADADPATGLDMKVEVDGYGEGMLSLRLLQG